MAKVAVAVRLDPGVVEWADAYAKERGVSRQAVLEGAVLEFREDAVNGAERPGLLSAITANASHRGGELTKEVLAETLEQGSKPRSVPPVVAPRGRPARSSQSALAMARMRRMNPNRYG